ncbi:MAG: hypothetical protein ACXWUV_03375 [Allosphingosinicella sp.]
MVDHHPIDTLRDPQVRSRLTSDSTFYIAPMKAVAMDPERAVALCFARPGDPPPQPERDYDLGRYGPGEAAAIRGLERFEAPPHYKMPAPSPAAEFMLDLSRDIDLQRLYRQDPAQVINQPRFAGLSDRARKLLAIPHPRAINAAIGEPARASDPA